MGAGGPKTEQGKAIVARNAVRHGVLSPNPVVSAVEKASDWEAHRQSVLASINPVGGLEEALAERVALGLWRLGRVVRFETECIARQQESVAEKVAPGGFDGSSSGAGAIRRHTERRPRVRVDRFPAGPAVGPPPG